MSLTTAQRDLLQLMLNEDGPIGAPALAQHLHLTPRQIHYGLREVKNWLEQRGATVAHVPGVGMQITSGAVHRQHLRDELAAQTTFQLVLTPDQRQQLLAVYLLTASTPLTLGQLQQDFAVARVTVLKDLDVVETWLRGFDLTIARRQHRGCWVSGSELAQRQALAAHLWGDIPFIQPLIRVSHAGAFEFVLNNDSALLPVVAQINSLLERWNLTEAYSYVAALETDLGGTFTDESVMLLALALAIQFERISAKRFAAIEPETQRWADAQPISPIVAALLQRIFPQLPPEQNQAEVTVAVLQTLTHVRAEPWRNIDSLDTPVARLINTFFHDLTTNYGFSSLARDRQLRDGLEAYVLSSYVAQRFGIWSPARAGSSEAENERYATERMLIARLDELVHEAFGASLGLDVVNELMLLLRAAVVRARPERIRRVLVVCPSGMATTQLLVARLKTRLPRLGTFEVLPIRELSAARVADADLIISTVPLSPPDEIPIDVIRVHPMLKPEDVAALTQWMA